MTHLCTTRHPMTEARRQHIHGPLLPMDRPDGEPSLFQGAAAVALVLVVATLWIGIL